MDTAAARAALEEHLRVLDRELGGLTEVSREPAAVSFGKRIGDGTVEAVERLAKVGAAKELASMRTEVVRALAKLDEGTYGICDRCGVLISEERLEARSWSVLCVRCASLRT